MTVGDLTIDGLGRRPASGRFVGLIFYRTGGVVRDLAVRNVHPGPADAAHLGHRHPRLPRCSAVNPALILATSP